MRERRWNLKAFACVHSIVHYSFFIVHVRSRWLFVAIFAFRQCHITVPSFLHDVGSLMIPICILFLFLSQFYWQKKEQMNVDLNTPFVSWQWHDLKCVPGKCAKVKGTSQLNGFVLYQRSGANFVCVCRSWLIIWLCDSSNDKCYQQQILFAIRSVLVKCFNFLAFCHSIVQSSNSLCVCLCEYRGTRKIAHCWEKNNTKKKNYCVLRKTQIFLSVEHILIKPHDYRVLEIQVTFFWIIHSFVRACQNAHCRFLLVSSILFHVVFWMFAQTMENCTAKGSDCI